MILTGECKEDFLITYYEESFKNKWEIGELELIFEMMPPVAKLAIIIDWLDKVGYTIDRDTYNRRVIITDWRTGKEDQYIIDCDYIELPFSNWYEEAIIKTNELYNNEANRTRRFHGDI